MMDEKAQLREYKYNKKRMKLSLEMRQQFIAAGMGTRPGREFFYWLLTLTGVNGNPFVGNALATAFNCGMLQIGQEVRNAMTAAAPELYMSMLKEQENERSSSDDSTSNGGWDYDPSATDGADSTADQPAA